MRIKTGFKGVLGDFPDDEIKVIKQAFPSASVETKVLSMGYYPYSRRLGYEEIRSEGAVYFEMREFQKAGPLYIAYSATADELHIWPHL